MIVIVIYISFIILYGLVKRINCYNSFKTGVYNNYKIDGSFFKLPLGEQKLYIKGISMQDAGTPMIEYSYLYY